MNQMEGYFKDRQEPLGKETDSMFSLDELSHASHGSTTTAICLLLKDKVLAQHWMPSI